MDLFFNNFIFSNFNNFIFSNFNNLYLNKMKLIFLNALKSGNENKRRVWGIFR